MNIDLIPYIVGAITIGSILGGLSAGFYGTRQRQTVTLLRESNNDYKERVVQLERKLEITETTVESLQKQVDVLKDLKTPDVTSLNNLVVKQHTDMTKILKALTDAVKKQQAA